jgi:hypothetical protein
LTRCWCLRPRPPGRPRIATKVLQLPLGGRAGAIRVADATGDGRLDLVVAGRAGTRAGLAVWVFAGNGDGTFAAPLALPVMSDAADVAVGDVTRDGRADVVVLRGNSLVVVRADGSVVTTALSAADQSSEALTVADVNADGALDALIDAITANGRVMLGDGTGGFRPGSQFPSTRAFGARAISPFSTSTSTAGSTR